MWEVSQGVPAEALDRQDLLGPRRWQWMDWGAGSSWPRAGCEGLQTPGRAPPRVQETQPRCRGSRTLQLRPPGYPCNVGAGGGW